MAWPEENPSSSKIARGKIRISEEWSKAAVSITFGSQDSPQPTVLVCGPKNSGKSTFSRHLLNVLLQKYKKVAFLDTDIGQTEFTPPGVLSLCIIDKPTPDLEIICMKTPERTTNDLHVMDHMLYLKGVFKDLSCNLFFIAVIRCYFFGDVSSSRDPGKYLQCVYALYDYYRDELCKSENSKSSMVELPLIVNTPGWIKGSGYEVLVKMLNYVSLTHVVKLRSYNDSKDLPRGAFWCDNGCNHSTLLEIKAVIDCATCPLTLQKIAALFREIKMIAYFRQCIPSGSNLNRNKVLARALAALPPYEVPISSIKVRHLHCQVPSSEVFYSLNASIVGLGISSEKSPDIHLCVGLGIVRGIDLFKGLLYVITPVPLRILEKVDILLQGFIQIPQGFLQAQGCVSPYSATDVLPIC
ncbi:hypothetical protein SAY86_015665 [Trapa natans]|uniref:Polynucleotide 5'-hydroxyl-kinase NOL9 n=1 Tax=Trapa natans TaxID=22666 RepID=A0AAN7R0H7_TRANT|nr:hypothetical protein SAY86_015665 [Trapa natans]